MLPVRVEALDLISPGVPPLAMFDKTIPFAPQVELMVTEEEDGTTVRWESEHGFTLSWAARGWGFGTVSFHKREEGDGLYCGDEFMGLENATSMLAQFCGKTPAAEWPQLLRQYGSAEKVMADVVDWESRPRDVDPVPAGE